MGQKKKKKKKKRRTQLYAIYKKLILKIKVSGEGNGNPLQCSCLENPRDGGAWWAAVYGVTKEKKKEKKSLCNFFCNLLFQISHHTSKRK